MFRNSFIETNAKLTKHILISHINRRLYLTEDRKTDSQKSVNKIENTFSTTTGDEDIPQYTGTMDTGPKTDDSRFLSRMHPRNNSNSHR